MPRKTNSAIRKKRRRLGHIESPVSGRKKTKNLKKGKKSK
jgi:hypothetical protein